MNVLKITFTGTCVLSFLLLFYTQNALAFFSIELEEIGSYRTGIFDGSAAEIVDYDEKTQRLFVINASDQTIDVLDASDPGNPTLISQIDITPYGNNANSVAIRRGIVAAAVQNHVKTDPGSVVFFDTDGNFINQITVGALPDMLTFSPNGVWLLIANEGEPNDDYSIDPEGSVSIIRVPFSKLFIAKLTDTDVVTLDFKKYNDQPIDPQIRIFGPNATVAQDLEPEYIAVSQNSRYAWVTLQENNALAKIDIWRKKVLKLIPLGTKDHLVYPLDPSDKNGVKIEPWPVKGMYQPDGIASYRYHGKTFLVTANEGDSRDYDTFSEEARVEGLPLDFTVFPNQRDLKDEKKLGRLQVTRMNGDTDGDFDFDELYAFGARSFSIWTGDGQQVYDSGDDFEQYIAKNRFTGFNADNVENNKFDTRSDNKGPEPEGVAIGRILNRYFAFIGLERVGGIMVYDITNPYDVKFVQYVNNRTFNGDPASDTTGDLGPEGLHVIPRHKSPNGYPLLVVGNEVSGSTTIYNIKISFE